MQTTPALILPAALRALVDTALESRHPMIVAHCDPDGQPVLSFRGSVRVFGDAALSMWIRRPQGRFVDAIRRQPKIALMYRNEDTRATYQFQGRARIDDDPDVRERVWSNAPAAEQRHDPVRAGAAVIVDLDRVEGYAGVGPAGQIDKLLLVRPSEAG